MRPKSARQLSKPHNLRVSSSPPLTSSDMTKIIFLLAVLLLVASTVSDACVCTEHAGCKGDDCRSADREARSLRAAEEVTSKSASLGSSALVPTSTTSRTIGALENSPENMTSCDQASWLDTDAHVGPHFGPKTGPGSVTRAQSPSPTRAGTRALGLVHTSLSIRRKTFVIWSRLLTFDSS